MEVLKIGVYEVRTSGLFSPALALAPRNVLDRLEQRVGRSLGIITLGAVRLVKQEQHVVVSGGVFFEGEVGVLPAGSGAQSVIGVGVPAPD